MMIGWCSLRKLMDSDLHPRTSFPLSHLEASIFEV